MSQCGHISEAFPILRFRCFRFLSTPRSEFSVFFFGHQQLVRENITSSRHFSLWNYLIFLENFIPCAAIRNLDKNRVGSLLALYCLFLALVITSSLELSLKIDNSEVTLQIPGEDQEHKLHSLVI
jgi:hypothetical protein